MRSAYSEKTWLMPTDDVEFLDFPQPKFIALSTDATDSSSASRSMSGCHNRYFSTTKRIFRRLGAIPRFAVHPRLSQSKRSVGKIGYHGSRPEFVADRRRPCRQWCQGRLSGRTHCG